MGVLLLQPVQLPLQVGAGPGAEASPPPSAGFGPDCTGPAAVDTHTAVKKQHGPVTTARCSEEPGLVKEGRGPLGGFPLTQITKLT